MDYIPDCEVCKAPIESGTVFANCSCCHSVYHWNCLTAALLNWKPGRWNWVRCGGTQEAHMLRVLPYEQTSTYRIIAAREAREAAAQNGASSSSGAPAPNVAADP